MSSTYGHNIVASEAFSPERFGTRLASSRPRRRIEVEPAKADRTIEIIAVLCAVGVALATYGGVL